MVYSHCLISVKVSGNRGYSGRRLGKDISVAKLQAISAQVSIEMVAEAWDDATLSAVAFSSGIKVNMSSLGQQDKALLRGIALLKQSTSAMGDYARTIESPANQMRVFSARAGEMVRALGNMFIPMISAVLPYITAFVQIITEAANAIAKFFKFELPKIDYSSLENVGSSIGGIENSLDDATASAKKLKGMLAGFDELNVIQQQDTGATAGGGISGTEFTNSLSKEFERLADEYDKIFGNAVKMKTEEIANSMKTYFEPLIPFFQGIGTILMSAWDTLMKWNDKYFYPWLVNVGNWAKENPETLKKMGEWVAAIGVAFLSWKIIKGLATPFIFLFKVISGAGKAFKIFGASGAIGKLFVEGGLFSKMGATLSKSFAGISPKFATIGKVISTGFAKIFGAGGIIATIGAKIGALLAPIGTAFAGLATALGISVGALAAIVAGVVIAISAIILNWDKLKVFFTETIPTWWSGTVVPFFSSMWNGIVENTQKAWGNFKIWLDRLPEAAGEAVGKMARHFVDFFTVTIPQWFNNAKKWLSDMVSLVKQWGANTWNYLSDEIPKWINGIVTWISTLPTEFKKWLLETYNKFVQWGADTLKWIVTEVPKLAKEIVDKFLGIPTALYNIGVDMITGLWNGIKSVWESLTSWWDDVWGDFKRGFEKGFNSNISIDAKVKQGSVKGYASGGFPQSGEFFMARENGIPEMVGAIGSRTAVANNDQIVDGIAKGVAEGNTVLAQALSRFAQQVVEEIKNNRPVAYIGDKDIFAAESRARSSYSAMVGVP